MFQESVSSFLDKKACVSNQKGYKEGLVDMVVRKVGCGSVWCSVCKKRVAYRMHRELEQLDWERARHIVLSYKRVDGEGGERLSGELNYERSVKEKHLNAFIRDLRREMEREGRVLGRGVWVREWHPDGYQHFHVIVETDNGDMIGNRLISKVWRRGFTDERYFKSKQHFQRVIGYVGKNGYFAGEKGHQGELPEWALSRKGGIRRYGYFGKEKDGKVKSYGLEDGSDDHETEKKPKMDRFKDMTYKQRHDACGSLSRVFLLVHQGKAGNDTDDAGDMVDMGEWDIPYNQWKEYSDRYQPRYGLIVSITNMEYIALADRYRLNPESDNLAG